MKIFKIIVFIIASITISANTAFSQTASNTEISQTEEVKTFKVKVKGVGCSRDIKEISKSVENLKGVKYCNILKKGATTTFEVQMVPCDVSEQAIYTAIEGTAGCKNPNDRPYKVKQ